MSLNCILRKLYLTEEGCRPSKYKEKKMNKLKNLSLLLTTVLLASCKTESSELFPCMCDPYDKESLGIFNCMCEPATKKPVKKISYIENDNRQENISRYGITPDSEQQDAYFYLHKSKGNFAPVELSNVDFRILKGRGYEEYDQKLGNYRFRIFGCRREAKNVYLNQGRAMEKDMRFFDIFYEQMNDFYPVVVAPNNRYYPETDPMMVPEYLLTAEITDYFMNICDEFDWNSVKGKDARSGSSEITITWRLMDLAKENVYCKGVTTGYGEIQEGETNGETLLVERAFRDALNKVPQIECYNRQLAQRVSPVEIERQIAAVEETEIRNRTFKGQYDKELKGVALLQECGSGLSQNGQTATTVSTTTVVNERGGITATGYASNEPAVLDEGGRPIARAVYGSDGRLYAVDEHGGSSASGFATKETVRINSDGYILDANGVPYAKAAYGPNGELFAIEERGGSSASGYAASETNIRTAGYANNQYQTAMPERQTKGLSLADKCRAVEVDKCTTIQNLGVGVTVADDYWLEVPLDVVSTEKTEEVRKTVEKEFSSTSNNFCIQAQAPYAEMSPDNLYRLRAAVVEVVNPNGKKGAGLVISDKLVLTSADMIVKGSNDFDISTINGLKFKGSAFRVNPKKNVAVLSLETPVQYNPLPISIKLPEVNKDTYMTLGLLSPDDGGEGYLDNEAKVTGYRYSEERGAEIIVNTFVQNYTLGSTLIDRQGNILGLGHTEQKVEGEQDLFLPLDTALKSLGISICGRKYQQIAVPATTVSEKVVELKVVDKPLTEVIETTTVYTPETLPVKERK